MPSVITLSDGWAAAPDVERGDVGLGAEDELTALDGGALRSSPWWWSSPALPPSPPSPAFVVAAARGGQQREAEGQGDDAMPRWLDVLVLHDVPRFGVVEEMGARAGSPVR